MSSSDALSTPRSLDVRPLWPALMISSLLLELFGLLAALGEAPLSAALLHLTSALALGGLVYGRLPERGRSARTAAIGAALLAVCLPALGVLGVLAVGLPTWRDQAAAPPPPTSELPLPTFSAEALAAEVMTPVVTPLADALSPEAPLARRVAAVQALRHMEAPRAVPLLRAALADPAEDVRLLAHAILDRRERALRMQLDESLTLLRSAANRDGELVKPLRARAHTELASHYWELAYGGFGSAESARGTLEKAAYHALEAAELTSDGATALIVARAYLRLGELEPARSALDMAELLGVGEAALAPLVAELAFLAGRFDRVAPALARLSVLAANRPELAEASRFWAARGRS